MCKEKLLIIGTGHNAQMAFQFVTEYDLYEVVGFAVDREYLVEDYFENHKVYAIDEIGHYFNKNEIKLFVALLWNKLNADRKELYLRLKKEGYLFANLISPHSIIHAATLGENCWVHDNVVIQRAAQIGDDVALMAFSLVGSTAIIGDHCFLGAKSTVAGGCIVGNQTFIGINATVFDDREVGNKCIIGACTAIKRNVPDYTIVKLKSDNIIATQANEDEIEEKLLYRKNVK